MSAFFMALAHYYFNFVCAAAAYRDNTAFYCLAVNCHRLYTLAYVGWVLDCDIEGSASEFTYCCEAVPLVRNRRIYLESVKYRLYTQNVL